MSHVRADYAREARAAFAMMNFAALAALHRAASMPVEPLQALDSDLAVKRGLPEWIHNIAGHEFEVVGSVEAARTAARTSVPACKTIQISLALRLELSSQFLEVLSWAPEAGDTAPRSAWRLPCVVVQAEVDCAATRFVQVQAVLAHAVGEDWWIPRW